MLALIIKNTGSSVVCGARPEGRKPLWNDLLLFREHLRDLYCRLLGLDEYRNLPNIGRDSEKFGSGNAPFVDKFHLHPGLFKILLTCLTVSANLFGGVISICIDAQ